MLMEKIAIFFLAEDREHYCRSHDDDMRERVALGTVIYNSGGDIISILG